VNISYGVTALAAMRDMAEIGPSVVTGVSETPSRKRDLHLPAARREPGREPALRRIVKNLTAQAYRGARRRDDIQDALEFYAADAMTATSRTASVWRCSRFWSARGSCSGSNRRQQMSSKPRARIVSATRNWRRGCRFSCGAPVRTLN
jgi:hypothetical protein